MKLVLENKEGKAVRTFVVDGDSAAVINRRDTRRLEVHASTDGLKARKIAFEHLGEIHKQTLETVPFAIGESGVLRLVSAVGEVVRNEEPTSESSRSWYVSLASLILLMSGLLTLLLNWPVEEAKMEEAMKQQLVQIVKKIPPKTQKVAEQANTQNKDPEVKPIQPTKKTASLKRLGALSVLGELNKGRQRGGLNLGAVNTTAGPGLGGTQGSGGVQTTLYGKGLVAAPLGAGSNMQGGGGYGTKGKGGGQAGYGKLSLVGSAGAAPIPLGREAIIEGGLDRDLIADVINRNMGQIRFCYEQGLQGDPSLAGRVAIGFVIGGGGQVKIANVASTTLNSKLVEECIVMRLRSWKFPLPEGGVDVKVSYPFNLRRAGQG